MPRGVLRRHLRGAPARQHQGDRREGAPHVIHEHAHVAIVGPVGTGKTFLATALGHVASRKGYSVLMVSADGMLRTLKHSLLDNSHEAEMRKLVAVDLLIVDDVALDTMDATESRDTSELLRLRHRAGSMIVSSNRTPDEWLATFADLMRAQSTIDRFANNAYDLVIDGESYRPRLKPSIHKRAGGAHVGTTVRRRGRGGILPKHPRSNRGENQQKGAMAAGVSQSAGGP